MKRIKKLFGKVKSSVKKNLHQTVRNVVASHPTLIPTYYHVFNPAFRDEMRSVFFGGSHHAATDSGDGVSNDFAFRRNVHRLEKGLIMRPRRPIFAVAYIESTVAYFENLAREERKGAEDREMLFDWSRDVLSAYFEVVEAGSDANVDCARSSFEAACANAPNAKSDRKTPFEAAERQTADVSIDDFEILAKNRKSVRWFKDRKVPRDVIDRAIDAARFSPSACNRQPFEIRVYDDPEMLRALASLPGGTGGFYENFPCLMVFVGKLQAFPKERDRHLIYIDASLAAMSLVFGLESMQVGTCIINWPDIPEKETALAKVMGLEPDERVVMMMAAGYPDPNGRVCWSQRKPLDEIRSFNKLTSEPSQR